MSCAPSPLLSPPLCRVKSSEPPDSPAWGLLEGLLLVLSGGELIKASHLAKMVEKIRSAHRVSARGCKMMQLMQGTELGRSRGRVDWAERIFGGMSPPQTPNSHSAWWRVMRSAPRRWLEYAAPWRGPRSSPRLQGPARITRERTSPAAWMRRGCWRCWRRWLHS